jgi:hypothetical protein
MAIRYDPLTVKPCDLPISIRSAYPVWIRASGATLVLSAAFLTGDDSWIAATGLTIILLVLLIGGILLFIFGIHDLIRDLWHSSRMRSEKKRHA